MIGFVDIETTGLEVNRHSILEVALVLTDNSLEEKLRESFVVSQSHVTLNATNSWCEKQHKNSGLISEVKDSNVSNSEAEKNLIKLFQEEVSKGVDVPMAGNSVHFDREFLKSHMPGFENCFHYRNIDVSVFRELLERWGREEDIWEGEEKPHRAMGDVERCIKELKYYQKLLFS